MARKDGKDRGILQRKGRDGWWVRLYVNGRERWFLCDTKSQARALYGKLKADIREAKFFPDKFSTRQEITLRAWILRCLDGSTNRGIGNERRYGRRWSLLLGKRLLTDISIEDLSRVQAKMRARIRTRSTKALVGVQASRQWSTGTINRHFTYLQRVLMLAVKDGQFTRNPVSGIKFLPEERRTRFLSDQALAQLERIMPPHAWKLVRQAEESWRVLIWFQ